MTDEILGSDEIEQLDEEHELSPEACGWCGRDPASGFATISGIRYCHGEDISTIEHIMRALNAEMLEPSCYQEALADHLLHHHTFVIDMQPNPRYL